VNQLLEWRRRFAPWRSSCPSPCQRLPSSRASSSTMPSERRRRRCRTGSADRASAIHPGRIDPPVKVITLIEASDATDSVAVAVTAAQRRGRERPPDFGRATLNGRAPHQLPCQASARHPSHRRACGTTKRDEASNNSLGETVLNGRRCDGREGRRIVPEGGARKDILHDRPTNACRRCRRGAVKRDVRSVVNVSSVRASVHRIIALGTCPRPCGMTCATGPAPVGLVKLPTLNGLPPSNCTTNHPMSAAATCCRGST